MLERLWRGWRIAPLLTVVMTTTIALVIALVTVLDVARQGDLLRQKLEETGLLLACAWDDVLADSLYLGDVERLRRVLEGFEIQASITSVEVFDRSGRSVASAPPRSDVVGHLPPDILALVLRSDQGVVVPAASGALDALCSVTAGSEAIGSVRLRMDTSSIDAETRAVVAERAWQALAVLLLGAGLSYSLAQSLAGPVRHLIEATRQVASGERFLSADETRHDELGDLMVAFDEMAGSLRDAAEAKAEEHNQLLREEIEKRQQAQNVAEETNKALNEQIAWRTRLELERERVIDELEARNSEMERFNYTVSHDLKSPLVTIRGFVGLARGSLDAEASSKPLANHLSRIDSAAAHMQRMLEELLELSRIGHVMNELVPIEMGELAQEALELVGGDVARVGADVSVAPDLPMAMGDRHRVLDVFENLLANALKFRVAGVPPRIDVGFREDEAECVYYVRDNGVGIDPKYHEKIFGLFERLDTRTPGTGIGLALVKRIVERHGGRIWLESVGADRGSTFYFTMKAPAKTTDATPA